MTRQREYKIPEEHRERAKELSRAANHAGLRQRLAYTRWKNGMDAAIAGKDDEVLAAHDAFKALSVASDAADRELAEFLSSLDAAISSEPERWQLKLDDETLVYQMDDRGSQLPKNLIRLPGQG